MRVLQKSVLSLFLGLCVSLGFLVAGVQAAPAITSPTPGATLSGATETFEWTAGGSAVTEWWLYVGRSEGARDIYDSGSLGTALSDTVTGLPTDGSPVYVKLWHREGGVWLATRFTYTASTNGGGGLSAVPPWFQNLPAVQRFVRVLPTEATPEGEAVLDKETGLVWEQSPGETDGVPGITQDDRVTWSEARLQCARRSVGHKKGWRLAAVHELASLLDPIHLGGAPFIPTGHPFSNIGTKSYWSATTNANIPTNAWMVQFANAGVFENLTKDSRFWVWCVRGAGPFSEY